MSINNRTNLIKMKTILTFAALFIVLSLSGQKVKVSDNTFDSVMNASKVIYNAQKQINPVYYSSNKEYLTNDEIKTILGENFDDFCSALLIFQNELLIYSDITGIFENNNENILNIKYGKRLSTLPTYQSVTTTKDTITNEIVTSYKLIPFNY